MATSLHKGQIPLRMKGKTTCITHTGIELDLFCEECNQLACVRCLSDEHRGHAVCALSEITPRQRQEIQKFMVKTENIDLVQIDRYIGATAEQIVNNDSNFSKIAEDLQKQTEKLKTAIDLVASQTLTMYQRMASDNKTLLETYEHDLEKYQNQRSEQVNACKIALQRSCKILIYDTAAEVRSPLYAPFEPNLATLHFTPNMNPIHHIQQAFCLSGTAGSQSIRLSNQHHRTSVSEAACQSKVPVTQFQTNVVKEQESPYVLGVMQGNNNAEIEGQEKSCTIGLQHTTKVVDEWESTCAIGSICPATSRKMWTCCSTKSTLTLLDMSGKTVKEVRHNACTTNIATSATTGLWVCDEHDNILELVSDHLEHRFTTEDTAKCICITASNHVIVGMSQHMTKYTIRGRPVRTTAGSGKPLVKSPFRIAECPVTKNIAVIDRGSNRYGECGKASVVIMDENFNKMFDYAGDIHNFNGSKPFSPLSVAYDSVGDLVIGDCANNMHILISGRGEFIRTIHTDIDCSWAAGIDERDIVWAVFGGYHVKLLQYRSKKCLN